MSLKLKNYACPECDPTEREVFRHKGLCRSCTTYGEDGSVINAVKRVRSDEFGNPIQIIASRSLPTNRAGEFQNNGFRQPRKQTKRQRAKVATETEVPTIVDTLAGGEEE